VKIEGFLHKGLRQLYEDDNPRGIPAESVGKLHKMLAFLDAMDGADELRDLPSWKADMLTGNRKGDWSLSVTANRRLTFRVAAEPPAIQDLNLEDYH
jgi:toxin HigB-1